VVEFVTESVANVGESSSDTSGVPTEEEAGNATLEDGEDVEESERKGGGGRNKGEEAPVGVSIDTKVRRMRQDTYNDGQEPDEAVDLQARDGGQEGCSGG
jgi:hypothetical protein